MMMMLKLTMVTIGAGKASILLINERRLFGRKKGRSLKKVFSTEEALSLEEVRVLEKAVSFLRSAMVLLLLQMMMMRRRRKTMSSREA